MKPRITLTKTMLDPQLFGGVFARESFWPWRTVAKLIDGIPLTEQSEIELFKACTGRAKLPVGPVRQLYLLCGRRAGKDRFFSAVAVWRAALAADWQRFVSPGEGAVVLTLGADKKQAAILRNYCLGLLKAPLLAREVVRQAGDVTEFRNGSSVEVATNDVSLVRGRSAIAFLGSETCHWKSDETSASSDEEVAAAAAPSLAMCIDGGVMLLGSSVYRKRGLMWRRFKQLHGNDEADAICWLAPSAVMNPVLPPNVVAKALADDRARAQAEYMSVWREDLADFMTADAITRCVTRAIAERPPVRGLGYIGFSDPSGGSSDSFAACVGHVDHGRDVIIIDAIREVPAPFSPEAATSELATFFKSYGCHTITGDRYAGAWPAEQFSKFGITYTPSAKPKSDLYVDLLPAINSGRIELLDHARLVGQLASLERRVARGTGKDTIDHPQGAGWHDDVANVVAGVASLAIGAGSYDSSYAGFTDNPSEDPVLARTERAKRAFAAEWGPYSKPLGERHDQPD